MTTPKNTNARFVVSLDFLKKAMGDCIPDERMEEIVKRLVAVIPDSFQQDIVRSEEAPQDRTKLWYVPSSQKLFVFNTSTAAWEETDVDATSVHISEDSDPALQKDEFGHLFLDSSELAGATDYFDGEILTDSGGSATKTVTLFNISDEFASVEVMPKTDMGVNARWWVSDQEATSATVSFAGLAANTSYSLRIVVRKTNLQDDV